MTQKKSWIWFFVVLGILTVAAPTILIWFNFSQQLTREKLAAARAKWKAAHPLSYDLEYSKKGSVQGTYFVQVRDGKVASATLDQHPLEPRLYASCDMLALFDDIDRLLEMDAQAGIRTFNLATFDSQDGHLIHYRRSVDARLQVEITVQLRVVSRESSTETFAPVPQKTKASP